MPHFFDTEAKVCGETYIHVRHDLLVSEAAYDELQRVPPADQLARLSCLYSHPQALEQCTKWTQRHCPQAKCVPVASTSEAARIIAASTDELHDGISAALGSPLLARQYKLRPLRESVQDSETNTTRFLVIAKTFGCPSGKDRTWLTFGLKHEAGSLATALDIFARSGINLSGIESYPNKTESWAYNFLVELEGHVQDPQVAHALGLLRQHTTFISLLGSFADARTSLPSLS